MERSSEDPSWRGRPGCGSRSGVCSSGEDALALKEGGEGGERAGEREKPEPPCAASAHGGPSFLPGPQCPLPFSTSAVAGGVILCERASGAGGAPVQRCRLLCRRGYRSAFLQGPLVCSLEEQRWVSQPPQPHACQRECPPRTQLSLGAQGGAPAFSPPECSISMVSQVASGGGERAPRSIF